MREITDAEFDKLVIDGSRDVPVLVFYYAEWAGPCEMLRPTLEDLAGRYGASLKVYALNIEDSPNAAIRMEVKGVPALLLFSGCALVGSKVGAIPADHLNDWLAEKGAL